MKKRFFCTACVFLLLCVLTMPVYATEVPDLNRTGSIQIHMTCEGEVVPGGTLTIYPVADVHVENGATYSYQYNEAFAGCPVSLESLSSAQTARDLEAYARENNIPGTKSTIDENGYVSFQNLPLGLYLLVQEDPAEGYSMANPFLVTVPGMENDVYVYDVNASPKLQLEQLPTEPPTDPPTDPTIPDLPQTGQNNLPIPILIVLGIGLCTLGVTLMATDKKNHEK